MITVNTIKEELKNSNKGTSFVNADVVTLVKLTGGKKNPDLGRIEKIKIGLPLKIHTSHKGYENEMKRETNNPDFKVGERKWGTRQGDTPIIEHKGEFYIDAKLNGKAKRTIFLRDGKECDISTIQGMPKPRTTPGPLVTTFKLSNIKRLAINKKELV